MKIFATGEAQSLGGPGIFINAEMERIVGVIDLGPNNSHNDYGWCGIKAVISKSDNLFILDFPADIKIETWDGILVDRSWGTYMPWWPSNSKSELDYYDLYVYDLTKIEQKEH